ncbi:hypothetical protein AXE80_10800 [Wenyingzhuangia fucanilytica]|uniref:Uncharacterized protein n=1 Tax=Wenyingzhuangia fucanilytica TaxID=1790137 RepID=A0A1B1Y7H8_9FLAO|nr:hypothetical protein [Wenyingzhuangia fucanilytica]ANW96732.1 hypothetical protein AXE80_10800 [Wenyingzhuangia fucanilytica]
MNQNCFQIYFYPVFKYVKSGWIVASENNGVAIFKSSFWITFYQIIKHIYGIEVFGVDNLLILLVLLTIWVDARYGIKKSKKQSKMAFLESKNYAIGSPEHKKFLRIYELKKFQFKKLQYTFFKCFTFLAYLFFVNHFLKSDTDGTVAEILGFTAAVALRIPLLIFWYLDVKSIGDNSEFVYEKKAPIFKIIDDVLGWRIKKLQHND